jgi:heparanase
VENLRSGHSGLSATLSIIAAALMGGCSTVHQRSATLQSELHQPLGLAALPEVATVDERFQSYNVEMVEVTGGRFWAPYGGPPGELYRQRPPEDLGDRRLRALARHLGPSYMRVSGTWANSTYLEAEGERLTAPPEGYEQVLTREQWRGVVDFAKAVNAEIGISYAVSEGPRGPGGVWQTEQAQRILDLTREAGGDLAFAEYINEPNAASLGRLPRGYAVADYTRDFAIFREWARRNAPDMLIVGPGGVGEAELDKIPVADLRGMLLTHELMKANPNTVDVVSYHFYGGVSQRCANRGGHSRGPRVADRTEALTPEWLDLTLQSWTYYTGLRDKHEPGDPIWITETAQAACGGSPWAASFVDSFRYVNQLGLLAQRGVQVVFHNTLGASDYSLIEEGTREPRPNYWAAVLWRRIMGTTVLGSPAAPSPDLRLYAHCLPNGGGGVGLAAINLGDAAQVIPVGDSAQAWVLQSPSLDGKTLTVNGTEPRLAPDGMLAGLEGAPVSAPLSIPGNSIAFVAVPHARNPACQ